MNAFRYGEAKLAERMGVGRGLLKSIRDRTLDVDLDWQKIGGEIALSNRGLKRVWRELRPGVALFDLRDCLILSPSKKNGAAVNGNGAAAPAIPLGSDKMPMPITAKVVQVCLNPYVVNAVDEHGLRQLTWVGDNANFSVGMSILVIPKKNAPGYWHYIGPMPQRRYAPAEWERRLKGGFNG